MQSRRVHRHPRLWLAGRAAALAGQVLVEKIARPKATTRSDVPGTIEAITSEWLSAVLCADVPGAEVTAFAPADASSGTSERSAFHITYNQAGRDAGLPQDVFAKLSASYGQRMVLGPIDGIYGETHFFNRFRPKVDMEAPLGYWCAADERTWKSVVIMDDIARTKGATFHDPTTPVTRAQIEDLVQNIARLHGGLWQDPELAVMKTPSEHAAQISSFIDFGKRGAVGMERAKAVIPSALHGQADRIWKATLRSLKLNTETQARTFLHGDPHLGQTYKTADGRMGLADWQIALQGGWAYDFAYLVASSCEPHDRRAWEKELLELYLERLGQHGGKPPGFDEAWLTYRQNLFYPYQAWAFTIGRAAYQPVFKAEDRCLAIIKRTAAALHENKAFDALGV